MIYVINLVLFFVFGGYCAWVGLPIEHYIPLILIVGAISITGIVIGSS